MEQCTKIWPGWVFFYPVFSIPVIGISIHPPSGPSQWLEPLSITQWSKPENEGSLRPPSPSLLMSPNITKSCSLLPTKFLSIFFQLHWHYLGHKMTTSISWANRQPRLPPKICPSLQSGQLRTWVTPGPTAVARETPQGGRIIRISSWNRALCGYLNKSGFHRKEKEESASWWRKQ